MPRWAQCVVSVTRARPARGQACGDVGYHDSADRRVNPAVTISVCEHYNGARRRTPSPRLTARCRHREESRTFTIKKSTSLRDGSVALETGVVRRSTGPETLARGSDLIATVPERHTATRRTGLHRVALPVPTPAHIVSLLYPRLDADPAHRWLRQCVREALRPTEHRPVRTTRHATAVWPRDAFKS